MEEQISKIYDYITAVCTRQGYVLPVNDLYGDGSRWNYNFSLFEAVYNKMNEYLNS